MASKAGRVQFKDIKVGKTFWMVRGGYSREAIAAGVAVVNVWPEPDRVVVTQKPYRTQIEDGTGLRPEWTFQVKTWYDELNDIDCNKFGIQTDVSWTPLHPTVDFLFVTRKAALRYSERMRRAHHYRVAFEHPCQWTRTRLRKRIGEDWKGKRTVYADIPTPTNSHRGWLYTAPLETLIGGVVVGPFTPPKHAQYFLEQSNKELAMMYPNVIEPINLPSKVDLSSQLPDVLDQGELGSSSACAVVTATGSFDKLKYDDPFVGIDVAKGEEGVRITSLVLGNGDKITKVYTEAELDSIARPAQRAIAPRGTDRHIREIYQVTKKGD